MRKKTKRKKIYVKPFQTDGRLHEARQNLRKTTCVHTIGLAHRMSSERPR